MSGSAHTLQFGDIHAKLVPLFQNSHSPLLDELVEARRETGHTLAEVFEVEVDAGEVVGHAGAIVPNVDVGAREGGREGGFVVDGHCGGHCRGLVLLGGGFGLRSEVMRPLCCCYPMDECKQTIGSANSIRLAEIFLSKALGSIQEHRQPGQPGHLILNLDTPHLPGAAHSIHLCLSQSSP